MCNQFCSTPPGPSRPSSSIICSTPLVGIESFCLMDCLGSLSLGFLSSSLSPRPAGGHCDLSCSVDVLRVCTLFRAPMVPRGLVCGVFLLYAFATSPTPGVRRASPLLLLLCPTAHLQKDCTRSTRVQHDGTRAENLPSAQRGS